MKNEKSPLTPTLVAHNIKSTLISSSFNVTCYSGGTVVVVQLSRYSIPKSHSTPRGKVTFMISGLFVIFGSAEGTKSSSASVFNCHVRTYDVQTRSLRCASARQALR